MSIGTIKLNILTMSSRVLARVLHGASSVESSSSLNETLSRSIQVSNSSLSFLASLAMAIMIAHRKNGGLSTPYRRIVFGLSISDILQSLALLTGPWSVAPSPSLSLTAWGHGNDTSCRVNGFFFAIGSSAVPMYTSFLCTYYLCKLKYRMNDEKFWLSIERKIHCFIVIFNLSIGCAALALDVFHTTAYGSFCYFALVPLNCRFAPEVVGECDPTIQSRVNIFLVIMSIPVPTLCLLAIIVIMLMLFWHALKKNRIIEKEISELHYHDYNVGRRSRRLSAASRESGHETNRRREREEQEHPSTIIPADDDEMRADDDGNANDNNEDGIENDEETPGGETKAQRQVRHLSRLYKRESLLQASCYVGTFLITYITVIVSYWKVIIQNEPSPVLELIGFFFFPLGGLFNIFVYARPNAASLRRRYPAYSRIKAYWLVLRAGGELPRQDENTDIRRRLRAGALEEGDSGVVINDNSTATNGVCELSDNVTPSVHLSHVMISSTGTNFTNVRNALNPSSSNSIPVFGGGGGGGGPHEGFGNFRGSNTASINKPTIDSNDVWRKSNLQWRIHGYDHEDKQVNNVDDNNENDNSFSSSVFLESSSSCGKQVD